MNSKDQTPMNQSFSDDVAPTQCPVDTDSPSRRKPYARKVWRTVAIIAAACIVLTGLFFAWLCIDFHPHKSLDEMGAVTFPLQGDDGMGGNKPGYPFTFLINEESSVKWDININCGAFLEWRKGIGESIGSLEDRVLGNLGKNFVVTNGKILYWTPYEQLYYTNLEHKNLIYIEAVIYAESHIIGYCVIQVHRIGSAGVYEAEILGSAYYPPQDGEYQNITIAHIRKQILKAKIFG